MATTGATGKNDVQAIPSNSPRSALDEAKRHARFVALMGAVVGVGAILGLSLAKSWMVEFTGSAWPFWFCILGVTITIALNYVHQISRILDEAASDERKGFEQRRPLREKAKRFAVELRSRYRFLDELSEMEQREWGLRYYEDLLANDAQETRTFGELSAADDFPAVIGDLGEEGRWLTSTWEKRGRLLSEVRRLKYDRDHTPKAPPPKKESDIERIRREFGVVDTIAQLEEERKKMTERYPDLHDDIDSLADDMKVKLKQTRR